MHLTMQFMKSIFVDFHAQNAVIFKNLRDNIVLFTLHAEKTVQILDTYDDFQIKILTVNEIKYINKQK